ncbi:MAG: flagellar basal body rod protein FlgB [Candidatus Zixiibacteriota bacterium]|nr:MAG: flagellar basal body rod protein FlgB [candidate division Zixibacteria bacterium]
MSNMIQKLVIDQSGVPLLKKYLDVSSLRHKLISGNIANVSTPRYRSKDVDFHGELRKAIGNNGHISGKRTHPSHLPLGQSRQDEPEIIVDKSNARNGINNVDIDKEMGDLAQNQIYYSIGARLLAKKFDGLKKAITSK